MDISGTVAGGNLLFAAVIAVAAGLVSFASPCVLPLVPGFLGYVTGLGGTGSARTAPGRPSAPRSHVVLGTALFILGFSGVFLAGMVAAAVVGSALIEHRRTLQVVGGVLVIAMALVFLGVGSGLGTQRAVAPPWRPAAGLWGAPLLGAVFAVGWTPCSGPTLGAISILAATDSPSPLRGLLLGLGYCLGLGLPFLLIAAGWSRAERASAWLRRHQRALQLVGGALLLALGILLLTGWWDTVVTDLQRRLIGSFEVVL